ncbi:DNA helicase [Biomphalaria pfeifferi]|uniref:DNA helicase n=1 Tax=Biomphalaria pfeifferi TaxID=112525 RepID=A0AAD8AQ27_BIOPF|nr:DNA helicase [Biomphalaria pfeifferi]
MSSVPAKKRAEIAGIQPTNSAEKQTLKMLDASNHTLQQEATFTAPHQKAYQKLNGLVTFSGAPKTVEESGLAPGNFEFDESQLVALEKLTNGKHVALIGAAGTGKTTMARTAMGRLIYGGEGVNNPVGIRLLEGNQGLSIALVAFTGIATQVISDTLPTWLRPAVKTIHSLLEYKPADEEGKMFVPTRNSTNKLDHDLIFIDEASMVGLDLWHNLIDALRPHTRIIMSGDLNQLKPVADATMFAYALAAGLEEEQGWSIAELTTIHRQKEPAANKIIDASQAILNGRKPIFDRPDDPDWRVLGYPLTVNAQSAHAQIIGAVNWLRSAPTPGTPDRAIFEPYKDLLLTAGNGEDDSTTAALVQQIPLNRALSRIIEEPNDDHSMYVIDAGRDTKRFTVGHRVMATKNESPDTKDRVTNGQTGRITKIVPNPAWTGNRAFFGTEKEVLEFRQKQAEAAQRAMRGESNEGAMGFNLSAFDTSKLTADSLKDAKTDRQASHIVSVKFGNGAERDYKSASEVHGLQLAYAMTVHKAQGSQADTVIVVVHQAVKAQLSREWLYTAVTRAKRRVIILYTEQGLTVAYAKQQIFGASLAEKVARYAAVMKAGKSYIRLTAYEKLTEHDSSDYSRHYSRNDSRSDEDEIEESEVEVYEE